jgi:hypothetical protein
MVLINWWCFAEESGYKLICDDSMENKWVFKGREESIKIKI